MAPFSFMSQKIPTRSITHSDRTISRYGGLWRIDFLSDDPDWSYREFWPDPSSPKVAEAGVIATGRSCTFAPPTHVHLRSTEHFLVEEGSMDVDINGRVMSGFTASSGLVEVPRGTRHTFWPSKSNQGPFVVKVRRRPAEWDERFFRNFWSYIVDTERHGLKPSLPQICLFLARYDSWMAAPSQWVPMWLTASLMWFIGVVAGEMLLGYKDSYPEYYQD